MSDVTIFVSVLMVIVVVYVIGRIQGRAYDRLDLLHEIAILRHENDYMAETVVYYRNRLIEYGDDLA